MAFVQADFKEEYYIIGIPETGVEVIMDDIILLMFLISALLNYLEVVLKAYM